MCGNCSLPPADGKPATPIDSCQCGKYATRNEDLCNCAISNLDDSNRTPGDCRVCGHTPTNTR